MAETDTLNQMLATAMAAAIAAGETTSEQLVRACLERIEAREPVVKAWAHLDRNLALAEARAADAAVAGGAALGPLHGVPVGLKDIIDTADLPTECGSAHFRGRRPANDATVVSLLRRAGAVILGKTITTEFALNGQRGTTNPHDPARTPGGSSSGSAAAVADHMVPLALGSQTGGSMLRPASYCGVYGYKPSYGRISRKGVFVISRPLDHLGVYANSLDDLALIADVLMVYDAADFDMRGHCGARLSQAVAEQPEPAALKLAFVKGPPWAEAESYLAPVMAHYLDGLGEQVHDVELAGIFDRAVDAHGTVMDVSLWHNLASYYLDYHDQLMAETSERIEAGRQITAGAYMEAAELAGSLNHAVDQLLGHYDAMITASATGEAPLGLASTGNAIFQRMWTLIGVPTLSLPLMTGPNGMPIGVQLIGRRGGDADLFRVAKRLLAI
ncbi:MAG: amidase [Rhodospirillales bacterium]|nr:amidase [Rhodospirillales bacterium]